MQRNDETRAVIIAGVVVASAAMLLTIFIKASHKAPATKPTYQAATIAPATKPRTVTDERKALLWKWRAEGSKIPSGHAKELRRLVTKENVAPLSFGLGEGEVYRLLNELGNPPIRPD